MNIKSVFTDIDAKIPEELLQKEVHSLHYDSRKIEAGDLFVAVSGFKADGHNFLAQVQKLGALAAVVEHVDEQLSLPQILVANTRSVMAPLTRNYYKQALSDLRLVGITGTNGKTSCGFLVQSILNEAGSDAGLIGTIAYFLKGKSIPAWNTTPESMDLGALLNEMHQQGLKAAVLEVSSHALALNRVDGLRFEVALFTNLSRDHLDFHGQERNYFQAKSRLFDLLQANGKAVLNLDDAYGQELNESLSCQKITFGTSTKADVQIIDWQGDVSGLQIQLKISGEVWDIKSKLIGAFNVQNIAAAVAVGQGLNLDKNAIIRGIGQLKRVPGRLEVYPLANGANVVIDYAHTPDALEKALQSLRNLKPKKLLILFGAGGDRDHGKRPLMGRAAEQYADFCIVSSDNPRTEEPQLIINEVLEGMRHPEKRTVVVNRRQAIEQAVKLLGPGEILLIAGKGHETYQDVKGVKYDFDEPAILKEVLGRV